MKLVRRAFFQDIAQWVRLVMLGPVISPNGFRRAVTLGQAAGARGAANIRGVLFARALLFLYSRHCVQ